MAEYQYAGGDTRELTIAELVKQLAEQTAALSRQEIRLAQLELVQKGKAAGVGAGLLGVSGVIGLLGVAAGLSTIGAAFAIVVPVWAAILIVTGLLVGTGAVVALAGRGRLQRAMPPEPDIALGSLRKDVETIKESSGR